MYYFFTVYYGINKGRYMSYLKKIKKTEMEMFTTTFHNFGRGATEFCTTWKEDHVVDELIYKELKNNKLNI